VGSIALKRLLIHIKNAWLILGISILLLLAVELLFSVLLALHRGTPTDPRFHADAFGNAEWAEAYFHEFNSIPMKWQPYVHWRREPFKGKYINVDQEGIRQTWNAKGKPPSGSKIFRIFIFGGSSLWGSGTADNDTIPSNLSRLLNEHGFNVEVTNFGESGYVSTQEIVVLLRQLQNDKVPDLAIFYDGSNDTFSTFQNRGVAGLPQNESNREREFNLLRPSMKRRLYTEAFRAALTSTATYQVLTGMARRITRRDVFSQEEALLASNSESQLASDVARIYSWNMRFVKALGEIYGFRALFYWQPNILTKHQLTSYEQQVQSEVKHLEMYYMTTTTGVKTRLSDVDVFHDISDVFAGDSRPYFFDPWHLSRAGNEIVARRILDDVAPVVQQKKKGNLAIAHFRHLRK
jgi:lysophospholipase L1-like esterase